MGRRCSIFTELDRSPYRRILRCIHPSITTALTISATARHHSHIPTLGGNNQALNAIAFLYKAVLDRPLDFKLDFLRARRPKPLPTVLSRREVRSLLEAMYGPNRLASQPMYGSGLRLSEALRIRVKDIDRDQLQVTVRKGKGAKDRVTMLPESLIRPLQEHLNWVRRLHIADLKAGQGATLLPEALQGLVSSYVVKAIGATMPPRFRPPGR